MADDWEWKESRPMTPSLAAAWDTSECPAGDGPVTAGQWAKVRARPGARQTWHDDCAEDAGATYA